MEKQILVSESYKKIYENKYERNNHIVGVSMWEFEWCPKYRYKMFKKWKYRELVEACISRAASMWGIKWIELSVQPDHIHLIAKVSVNFSPTKILQLIKGGSAYLFFKHHPKARLRYPCGHLWSPGKFIASVGASVGFTDLDFTISYVLHQEEHHFLSHGNQALKGLVVHLMCKIIGIFIKLSSNR